MFPTRDRSTYVLFTSFEKYQDMWISPNDCPMPHEVLGHLDIEVYPAILAPKSNNGIYEKDFNTYQYERISYAELLDLAVEEARARGADGISNLSITSNRREGQDYATRYEATGLLLKMK